MSSSIIPIGNPVFRNKMVAFDYDWTLVSTINGRPFSKDKDDWQWLYSSIPEKLKKIYETDYMIVIFTNQSKLWKHQQIINVIKTLDIPVYVVIATNKIMHKPNIELFTEFLKFANIDNIILDKDNSCFVGDALGRKYDFSDSDKIFAKNIGINYFSPEKYFKENKKQLKLTVDLFISSYPEIIIMMGFPGSGKTSIAKKICENDKYINIERDIYNTVPKMLKIADKFILEGKSIIFNATNSSIKNRKMFIDFAKKHINYKIKCIHVNTSLLESQKRNKMREEEAQVPLIAYSVYNKYFEEPSVLEGFELIVI
jgi:bifunctional polynucleotide phosphatase/kinase